MLPGNNQITTHPLYSNALINAGAGPAAATPSPNMLMPQSTTPQISPAEVNMHHERLDDMQKEFRQLIELPNEDLTVGRIYGAASDLITKYKLSNGKRGASPTEVVMELAGKDFPQDSPSAKDLKKYLIDHFNRYTAMQAALTTKFGPPQGDTNAR